MIPELNQSGVLPPFLPIHGPGTAAAMSPYKSNMTELVSRFGHNPERTRIMEGLLDYREELRAAGITNGFQWIDGSYVEDCEKWRGRPPRDVDVVTFGCRPVPHADDHSWHQFVQDHALLFDHSDKKTRYSCDAFYEDLNLPGMVLVSRARFWFGLFSHRRSSFLWKGLIEIPLLADDSAVRALIAGGNSDASQT